MPVTSSPTEGFAAHEAQAEILRRMEGARNYNEWMLSRSEPFLGDRVLDAGAGSGTFAELIGSTGRAVVAAEPDPAFVDALRRRFATSEQVTVVVADATGLEPDDVGGAVDSIVCFNVLEHIAAERRALVGFYRLLAPGGFLLLLVPAHPFLYGSIDRVVEHERRYRKSDLAASLRDTGFRVESLRLVNPVGAIGWLASSKVLRRASLPARALRVYDRLVPVLRALDRVELPFGLSVWAVARRPAADAASSRA